MPGFRRQRFEHRRPDGGSIGGLLRRQTVEHGEVLMAEGVYKIVEVVGVSEKSWEDAGRNAVETAAGSLRDLRVAEVTKLDMKVEDGKVAAFRTRVSLSFKYEA
jgi:flavin-binding protein dodecin